MAGRVLEFDLVPAAADPAVVVEVGLVLQVIEDPALIFLEFLFLEEDVDEWVVLQGPDEALGVDPGLVAFEVDAEDRVIILEALPNDFHLIPLDVIVPYIQMH